jgi:orotidine-5'-phosphate decarboxylase
MKGINVMVGFREMLVARQQEVNSLVCVGLDPLLNKVPLPMQAMVDDNTPLLFDWFKRIIDATVPFASMYKPQRAHYESIRGGVDALRQLIYYIHSYYPGIPVFLD